MTRRKKYLKHEIVNGEKICGTCLEMRPVDQFGPDKRNPSGLNYSCRDCLALPSQMRSRRSLLKNKYGITEEMYDEMLKGQNGVCKICKQPPGAGSTRGEYLHVDHCHDTNKIRGLLCHSCNIMLGMSRDSVNILESAIKYLSVSQDSLECL